MDETEILNQEPEIPTEETETPEENQVDETIEGEEESEVTDEEETPEETETPPEEEKIGAPPFNQLRKEFPDVFKKYPSLQANWFKAEKYSEFFPTVEDAESASRKVEIFDAVDQQLTQGDFKFLVDTLADSNPNALNKVAEDIVPLLQSKNPQLYVKVANPIFKQLIEKGFAVAQRYETSNDEKQKSHGNSLRQVFNVLQHFIWGEAGVPAEAPKETIDPEKERLKQQLKQQFYSTALNFEQETKTQTHTELKKMVESGISDPENKLTPFTKSKLVEQIIFDINDKMYKDPATQKQMQALWQNAFYNGFSEQSMVSINRAFLTRAKMITPRIRQNRLAEALGTAPINAGNGKTIIPSSGGINKNKSNKLTPQVVKEKGMSEADIINFGS